MKNPASGSTPPRPAAAPPRRGSLLAPPPEREPAIGAGAAAAIYLALALLYFLPAFLPGNHIFGTDYLASGYPFHVVISRAFATGHLPGWIPSVYGGVPLFANPGSTYYPVRFLADWLLPVKDIFPAMYLANFFAAGWGMYLLARELGARPWVAFVAGLCFQWTGILTSWVYAGHDGRIIVASLIPLFFCCLHRGVRTAALAPFAGAAATLGFALLSFQIQLCWYMLVGGLAWAVYCLVHLGAFRRGGAVGGRVVAFGLAAVALGFAMAAVNFVPFQGYVASSPRAGSEGRGYEFSVSFSMPVSGVVAMAAPEQMGVSVQNPRTGETPFPAYHGQNGFKLHTEYMGGTVLVLFALGFWYARRSRTFWFFGGMGLFFLTLALGGNTPLYRLYWSLLPGLKKFRAPDLAYGMVAFSLVTMAALALEAVARARDTSAERKTAAGADTVDRVPWIAGGVVVLAVLGAMASGGAPGAAAGWMRFALFAGGAALVLWLWSARRMAPTAAMVALALLTTTDLWVIGKKFFYTVPPPEEMFAADDVTGFLLAQRGPFRVWPVPGMSAWPQSQDYPMLFGIDQVAGEHSTPLQRYNEFLGAGQGAMVDFHNVGRDPRFLAAGDVKYLVLSQPVNDPSLREAFRGQQAIVYENTGSLGRAWLVGQAIRAGADATLATLQSPGWDPRATAVVESPRDLALGGPGVRGTAAVTLYQPDHVDVQTDANGAALLVLADNFYPGWKAAVDGRPAEIYRTNHTFRGVVVPAGRHRVSFSFEPAALYAGFYLYLATLALLAAYGVWLLVARRRRRDPVVDATPEPAAA